MSALRFDLVAGLAAIAALHLAAVPARAQSWPALEGIDSEESETELEIETKLLDAGDGLEQEVQIQVEHGLSDRWLVGAELDWEQDAGGRLRAEGALAKVKWSSARGSDGVGIAAQAGAGYSFAAGAPLVELKTWLGWASPAWSIIARIDLEQLLQGGARPQVGYRLRIARNVGQRIESGIETRGDLMSDEEKAHLAGPFVKLPLGDEGAPALELAVLAGLNRAAPDALYRIELEIEF